MLNAINYRWSDTVVQVEATNSITTTRDGRLHKLDLRGKNDKNWQDYHKEYIDILDYRMRFLPIHKPFFSLDTTACLEYMLWCRVTDKAYLLLVEARSK
ncbi:hypothetical protein GOBAR_AA17954 [Gossypium barbadense]|uniref:Uncharacterized protein n=1 Tax=Gossypium barbadense TaxID=3634 RepID=A0A2P5XH87_GOSBA|nr:hypothetical protein GOBAR_AA17954 [Gossypium barbadense]